MVRSEVFFSLQYRPGRLAGKALVLKVDTEAHPQLSARYQVRGIPIFLVLSGGKTLFQQAGLVGHEQMEQWLRSASAAS
jgi:thioredoxin 2